MLLREINQLFSGGGGDGVVLHFHPQSATFGYFLLTNAISCLILAQPKKFLTFLGCEVIARPRLTETASVVLILVYKMCWQRG